MLAVVLKFLGNVPFISVLKKFFYLFQICSSFSLSQNKILYTNVFWWNDWCISINFTELMKSSFRSTLMVQMIQIKWRSHPNHRKNVTGEVMPGVHSMPCKKEGTIWERLLILLLSFLMVFKICMNWVTYCRGFFFEEMINSCMVDWAFARLWIEGERMSSINCDFQEKMSAKTKALILYRKWWV